ncbi:hypothetical protein PL321_16545 [Caloramator sp. mosi_1]|uniref:hypothetical protein n=1 Tax=Caloramator sp. mosi_1 TaxID=3023090 RepID=UPI00235F5F81|nr:hypothetical protein [Caloramator sp. mosi_1]WDC83973.1 hypothetical protein PL321_16545 [Caloramator sp. mosi_1]
MIFLKDNAFLSCPSLIEDIKGQYYFKLNNHKYYYLTKWINGEECDIDKIENALNTIKLLSDFHKQAEGFYSKHIIYEDAKIIKEFTKRKMIS